MSTLVTSVDDNRPLAWFEQFQLALWIAIARTEGFPKTAEEAERLWDNPAGWRALREKIRALAGKM